MRLFELTPHLDVVEVRGDVQRGFTLVTRDTREASSNAVFVAIRGTRVDGHDLVADLDVAAVIVERDVVVRPGTTLIRVRDTKAALAWASAAIAGFPGRSLRVIGVTGTKGKTTTTTLIEGMLQHSGRTAGRIGTTGASCGGVAIPSELTTPEAPQLQALLASMRDSGATDVAMEVSSIGLVQRRVDAIPYYAALFTNLGHDHLDFHGTVDAYIEAKARLFRELLRAEGGLPRALLNGDDPVSRHMGAPADQWTVGFESADLQIVDLKMSSEGTVFSLPTPMGIGEIRSPLVGRHNAMNLAMAVGAGLLVGLSLDAACAGVGAVAGVPGRLEGVANSKGVLVVVDYAHTEESLAAVLSSLREVSTGKLWCVFGCGGDRDVTKRPRMGAVAARLADWVVVTSDNPRSEVPEAILAQIVAGMDVPPVAIDADRRAAIRWAIGSAAVGDVVLIAGKGHETYQEIDGEKRPFDDREEARLALEAR